MSESNDPWYTRGYLPHADLHGTPQFIIYRCADSLPADFMSSRLESDSEERQRIDRLLDAGYGSCPLSHPDVAPIIMANWRHFADQRYRLIAWVIMPNHVHVLMVPMAGWSLSAIIHGWKSYSATRINEVLYGPASSRRSRAPALWQREYWDRWIRDEGHFMQAVSYIHDNPVKAGLVATADEWPWSSASKVISC